MSEIIELTPVPEPGPPTGPRILTPQNVNPVIQEATLSLDLGREK